LTDVELTSPCASLESEEDAEIEAEEEEEEEEEEAPLLKRGVTEMVEKP